MRRGGSPRLNAFSLATKALVWEKKTSIDQDDRKWSQAQCIMGKGGSLFDLVLLLVPTVNQRSR